MNEEVRAARMANLKPFQDRPKGELKIISAKGGEARTQAKRDASKWRQVVARYKKKGMRDEDIKWMIEKIENRDLCAIDIMQYAEELKNDVHPAQRVALGNLLVSAGKFAHGEKIKTEALNVNVNSSLEEWERRLYES
jgi:hypothetical protein